MRREYLRKRHFERLIQIGSIATVLSILGLLISLTVIFYSNGLPTEADILNTVLYLVSVFACVVFVIYASDKLDRCICNIRKLRRTAKSRLDGVMLDDDIDEVAQSVEARRFDSIEKYFLR